MSIHTSMRTLAFVTGLAVVGWVGAGYYGRNTLALAMTAVIALVYLGGVLELWRFARQGKVLRGALARLGGHEEAFDVEQGEQWLAALPASLRQAVRARLEGERASLPAPALTPYLVGMLVLLGMLGTFLGMMITLDGAVHAIEATTELQRMRSALAAPVKGLGFAFGTSVAGVAASTMLGLMSALDRRQRLQDEETLEFAVRGTLASQGLAQQRRLAYQAIRQQGASLSALVDSIEQRLADGERRHQALEQQLLDSQERFHQASAAAFQALAGTVAQALETRLEASVTQAGQALATLVDGLASRSAADAAAVHQALVASLQRQLETIEHELARATEAIAAQWSRALDAQQQGQDALLDRLGHSLQAHGSAFHQQASALVADVDARLARLHQDSGERDARHQQAQQALLRSTTDELFQHWRTSSEDSLLRQQAVVERFEAGLREHAAAVQAQATASMAAASAALDEAAQAPRAAAAELARLGEQLAARIELEQRIATENRELGKQLARLVDGLEGASRGQLQGIEQLARDAAATLESLAADFAARAEAVSAGLDERGAEVASAAVEVASLGEAFGAAVDQFDGATVRLVDKLQAIEAALARTTARSDEQLAYYVAQARELIDLSLMAQQRLLEPAAPAEPAPPPQQGRLGGEAQEG